MVRLTARIPLIALLHAALLATAAPSALEAQDGPEPEFIITWQASSYAPSSYRGKVLPTVGSAVTFALELVDEGKLADLSGTEIRWYRNNNLVSSGMGQKHVTMIVPPGASREERIRAVAVDFRGEDREHTVLLPVTAPEVVIDAPAPGDVLPGVETRFRALPYFFNARSQNELLFEWQVNGEAIRAGTEHPDILDLSVSGGASGATVSVNLRVARIGELLEFAASSARYTLP